MENKRTRRSYETISVVRKGAWTADEDMLLKDCVEKFGEGKWHLVPLRAGLNRCRKSCRLRWLNYLRPNIKRGYFEEDEVDLMLRLHRLLGNRWSLIAGRIPGRTANDVKNYWNTHFKSCPKQHKEQLKDGEPLEHTMVTAIKPKPQTISKAFNFCPLVTSPNTRNLITSSNIEVSNNVYNISPGIVLSPRLSFDNVNEYLDELSDDREKEIGDEVGWSFGGFSEEGGGLNVVEQVDGQNSFFDFSIDEVVMFDLVDGEQL